MKTIRISDAQAKLPELVESLDAGDVLITRDERPVARLTRADGRPSLRDLKPVSLGPPLRSLERDDDLIDELLRS